MAVTKVFRAAGSLYGCAGDSFDCVEFRRWAEGGQQPGEKPTPKALDVIAIDDVRRIWIANESLIWIEVPLLYWAIGSGAAYALGAMHAGKTAPDAIRIASELDASTGLGVDALQHRAATAR